MEKGNIKKAYFSRYIKQCFFGLSLIFLACQGVQAQLVISYEINGTRGADSFRDSLSREVFLNQLIDSLQLEGFQTAFIHSKTFYGDTLEAKVEVGAMHPGISLSKGNLESRFLRGDEEGFFSGTHHDSTDLNEFFDDILERAQDAGFPFASIRLDSIVRQGKDIRAAIDFDSGPFITFDTVQVTGTSKIQPLFLGRLLRIAPGTTFSQSRIAQSAHILKKIPYVQVVGEPQLSFQNQEARLHLPLDDRRLNSIDGIIGVLPNETAENRMLITGQFDLALYNVGGRGRNYQLNWQRLSQHSQNLRISAEEPLLLGTMVDLKASFSLLKEDTTYLNRNFRVELSYSISPALSVGFFSRRQAGDLSAAAQWEETAQLPEYADFRYNSYGGNIVWSSLDDALWTRQGWFAEAEFGIGNKKLLQNTGLPASRYQGIDPNSTQYYFELDMERHVWISPHLGALLRGSAGGMESKNLFLNNLFRLGGLKTLRGFNENFFFAKRYVYANFEPRYYFDRYSYFLLFMDVGRIQDNVNGGHPEVPLSLGGGISLETDGGLFRFIYALGQSNTQVLGFNFSKIHFGYTGRF